jgi:signal transduction histidine kinase
MFKRLFKFLIPGSADDQPELLRRYRLIISIILITVVFDLNYAFTTITIGMKEGTYALFFVAFVHLALLVGIKKGLPLLWISNIYIFNGVTAIVVSIIFSGGSASPVLPWLASSPIMALLMAGRRSGIAWMGINTVLILFFGFSKHLNIEFPINYDLDWRDNLSLNCALGLIMIIFFVSLVFENGKNSAMERLEVKSLLLSEEKKKNALYEISQEIHDGIGQTLSVIKLNLHLLDTPVNEIPNDKLRETLLLAGKAIQDLRNISNNLYTENIQEFDLANALMEDVEHIRKLGKPEIKFTIVGDPYSLNPRTAFILYRVAREAVNNALRHAKANSIKLKIDFSETFCISIKDDGCGMESSGLGNAGQGILSMRDRMALLGGKLFVESFPESGTMVLAKINLPKNTAAAVL